MKTARVLCLLFAFIALSSGGIAWGAYASVPIEERLANAIYKAEGGHRTAHPYGIIARYKRTSPRQACINTIRHRHALWLKTGQKEGFIEYLSKTYAPIGASNDPTGLNKNWVKNVTHFYNKGGV